MKVMVRIKKSSDIQELFFGSQASRPYLLASGISCEEEIRNVIKAYICGDTTYLRNFRIKKYMKPVPGEFEYSIMSSRGFSKVVDLGFIS